MLQVPLAENHELVQALVLDRLMTRSAKAFRFGDLNGSIFTWMPSLLNISSKVSLNFVS